MCLSPGPAMGIDPSDPVPVAGAAEAVAWARLISDFGWYPEVFVLFLRPDGVLCRAAWLGAAVALDDFVAWPDFSLGYAPDDGVGGVILLVCRPGQGVAPTGCDREAWEILRLAHDARGVPLVDVVLVDGRRWCSMAGR